MLKSNLVKKFSPTFGLIRFEPMLKMPKMKKIVRLWMNCNFIVAVNWH